MPLISVVNDCEDSQKVIDGIKENYKKFINQVENIK
jgi:hypothetical protein